MPAKSGQIRDKNGRFCKGHSGNPAGRNVGITSLINRRLKSTALEQIEDIAQQMVTDALKGCKESQKFLLERFWPKPKDAPVRFTLPDKITSGNLQEVGRIIIEQVAEGNITPLEAKVISGILGDYAKVLELHELSKRIETLEEQL